jgi:hypothetical protein
VESFISEAFHEDLNMIAKLLMLVNPQTTFAMLLFYYAPLLGYLKCIVFSSPGILQCYTEFYVYTIAMMEKLLGSRSFGTILGHLACH